MGLVGRVLAGDANGNSARSDGGEELGGDGGDGTGGCTGEAAMSERMVCERGGVIGDGDGDGVGDTDSVRRGLCNVPAICAKRDI